MKPLYKHALALLAVCGAAGAVLWQQAEVVALQDEHAQLVTMQEEAAALAAQNQSWEKARALLPEVEKLKAANRDLLALRNQIRQSREANPEVDKLRAEIQRLDSLLKAPVTAPKSITEMEGFVAKENWTRGGFDTPEGAVQNFLWAMREGNFEVFLSCLTPAERESLEQARRTAGDNASKEMEQMRAMAARLKGYRIAEKTEEADGKVVLSLQVAAGVEAMKIPVQRVGQEWKILGFR